MSPCSGSILHIQLMWWIGGELVIDGYGTFKKVLVRIVDSRDQVLRRKNVRLVRVL